VKKLLNFLGDIGNILYVGGILSHIVIGILFAGSDPQTTVTVYTYKLQSAYILILPGLGLKIITDLMLFFIFAERAWWMWIKLAAMTFLTVNAAVFLVPMMPELLAMAEAGVVDGELSEAFHALEAREQLVGMSNIIPLLIELIMGGFKPAISKAERSKAVNA